MADEDQATKVARAAGKLKFHYVKSVHYRTLHADGIWGGPTPTTDGIYIAFYNQRFPIAQTTIHEIRPDGTLGKELSREGKDGVIREVEVGVTVDVATAHHLHKWLTEQLAKMPAPQSDGPNEGKKAK
jgi:hypothetical protein